MNVYEEQHKAALTAWLLGDDPLRIAKSLGLPHNTVWRWTSLYYRQRAGLAHYKAEEKRLKGLGYETREWRHFLKRDHKPRN